MDVRFLCIEGGRKYYAVVVSGEQLFVGTRGECARFQRIHEEKVATDHLDALRNPRSRAVPVRTYRQTRIRA